MTIKTAELKPLGDFLTQVDAILSGAGVPCHLVGGLLRDQLLGRAWRKWNVDLAVPDGAYEWGRLLADRLGGAFVPLDRDEGSVRVVLPAQAGAPMIELDINDYRAETLEADLRLRDFTINAMAVELGAWLRTFGEAPTQLVDPCGGRGALEAGVLQACFPGTFKADPLRVMRAYRFAAQLGFTLESETETAMLGAKEALTGVSAERIRDEWFAVLETERAAEAVQSMSDAGILSGLFPELEKCRAVDQGDFHHLDVLEHQIEAVRFGDRFLHRLEGFDEALRTALSTYCEHTFVQGRSVRALIKFAALIHDIGKPAHREDRGKGDVWFIGHEHTSARLAEPLVKRLALSNRESQFIVAVVRQHLRPGFLSRMPELTRKAVYRFYRDLGDAGPGCVLEWWCDRNATRGKTSDTAHIDAQFQCMSAMLKPFFFETETVVKPKRLVTGHELMRAFKLKPGPEVGELLAQIEEAQAEGAVGTAEEALDYARRWIQKKGRV